MTRNEFLGEAKRAALAASAKSGLPAGITVAQAALESNWGQSGLSKAGANYFGIKAHGKHEKIAMRTNEFECGQAKVCVQEFAKYENLEECFCDRDELILRMKVYAEARSVTNDPVKFVKAMGKHWATDPHYAEKVLRIYEEWNLAELDRRGAARADTAVAQSIRMGNKVNYPTLNSKASLG